MFYRMVLFCIIILFVGQWNVELCLIFSGFVAWVLVSDIIYREVVCDIMANLYQLRLYEIWYRTIRIFLGKYLLVLFKQSAQLITIFAQQFLMHNLIYRIENAKVQY